MGRFGMLGARRGGGVKRNEIVARGDDKVPIDDDVPVEGIYRIDEDEEEPGRIARSIGELVRVL